MNKRLFLALFPALLPLTGCALLTPPRYITPAGLTTQNAAALESTEIAPHMSTDPYGTTRLVPDIRIDIATIDGKAVAAPPSTKGFYVLVKPGIHKVTYDVGYSVREAPYNNGWGSITVRQNFVEGLAYGVMSSQPEIIGGPLVHSMIWVEDSSGNVMIKPIEMKLLYDNAFTKPYLD